MSRISLGVKEVTVIPREEAKELLKRMRLRPWQLPWIRASDPLAQKAGAKPGDVLKIVRESPTAGEAVVYRLVVPG
ncbi:DNA-directed RNA polymerase subunit H [Pyrobaculum aerophilum]|uniref:DNA-directed RNA polymerase subunit Rpo5 n=1 Tax=Pyrobaculum aerophilum TaxID=13773 RepID=A0A371QUD2_9CREN|nr:DNA-directed RNA polymerase subunit H [Pyrobaculum aerophilum]RFA93067.1 DNA-directed RNA polymerase subunit H [Pyrobaculum aerophilum]RFA99466.1 DNA-directed RNA polymerase subunit H [Pyrobaculum aerophilum]